MATNHLPGIRTEYCVWLRTFALFTHIGRPGDGAEIVGPTDEPLFLDEVFWSERTHEAEARAMRDLREGRLRVNA